MIKQIWKYAIDKRNLSIEMPVGAEILCLQLQHGEPYIWALVDTAKDKEIRQFEVYGTGGDIPCEDGIMRNYIGTFQMFKGDLVWHLFEIIKS